MIKQSFFDEKQQSNVKKVCVNKVAFFTLNSPTDPWYNMLQTLKIRRKYEW